MANIPKSVRLAKKTLENTESIQDLVEKNVIQAVEVLVDGMTDVGASPASRQTCAKEILKLHWVFVQATEALAGDPSNREEERKQEVGKGVVALFSKQPVSL